MIFDYESKKSDYMIIPTKIMKNISTEFENIKIINYFRKIFLIEDFSKSKLTDVDHKNKFDKIIFDNSINYLKKMMSKNYTNKKYNDSTDITLMIKKYYYKLLIERIFHADNEEFKKIFEIINKE